MTIGQASVRWNLNEDMLLALYKNELTANELSRENEEQISFVSKLIDIGLTENEVLKFYEYEKSQQYEAQEKLIRKYRNIALDTVHQNERLIGNIDYILFQIRKNKK